MQSLLFDGMVTHDFQSAHHNDNNGGDSDKT
jgi:hypothetical protein